MSVRYASLGGLGEVGMNCAVFEQDQRMVMLDCGVSFPDGEGYGIDQLVPDFTRILEGDSELEALIITHGHQDHIGAVVHLLREIEVPIYLPRYAEKLLWNALEQAQFRRSDVEVHVVKAGDVVDIGPFRAEFIHVTHSIPDTLAVALTTDVGVLVHTADFKIDLDPFNEPPFDVDAFKRLGDAGVRALFSDSTNILRAGRTRSESMVRDGILKQLQEPGRVLVSMFSTNMFRVQALIDACIETGRRLLILGRSLQRNVAYARDCGILNLPVDVFIDEKSAHDVAPSALAIACTGSQAQPRAALARMAYDRLAGFSIAPGDRVVFSARSIPGNEGVIARLQDQIVRRGGEIVVADDVHCSGHACRDEQADLLRWVRPQTFVPVHGDYRYLVAHAALSETLGVDEAFVLDNGDVLELRERDAEVISAIDVKTVCVDGTPFGHIGGETTRTRARLAERGLAIVTIVIDEQTGELAEDPGLDNFGLFDEPFAEDHIDDALDAIEDAFNDLSAKKRMDYRVVEETVRVAAMRSLRDGTKRKPIVHPVVVYA